MPEAIPLLVLLALATLFAWLWRREVGARLASERAARETGERLNAALATAHEEAAWTEAAAETSDDVILVCDRETVMRYANASALERFGDLSAGSSLIAYSGSLELEQLAQDALALMNEHGLERVIRIEDHPFQARAVSSSVGVAVALSDIAELQRLSRARQDFIANLSHELRTPLTSLRLLVDTLVRAEGKNRELAVDLAEKMDVEVEALHLMAQEMLDLAAIESGQQVVKLLPLSMRDLVEGCVSRVRDAALREGIHIRTNIPMDIQILADPEQATRALLNVLNNALRFAPEAGMVGITGQLRHEGSMALLSVSDTGSGIPPADLDRIFERFYRGDQPEASPGTGLGLAIARHIMKAHGGRIWAENRVPPERGAIFNLTFHRP